MRYFSLAVDVDAIPEKYIDNSIKCVIIKYESEGRVIVMMYDRKEKLMRIFEDTERFAIENPALALRAAEARHGTAFYAENDYPALPDRKEREGRVTVTRSRTFEAATKLRADHPDWRITVLNFASATNPGGGVRRGSSAQEESLCRCSTLYHAITRSDLWDVYYTVNRAAGNPLYTDALIYTPGVTICKTDEDYPRRLPQPDWVSVDVITCAAPNLSATPGYARDRYGAEAVEVSADQLYEIHRRRANHILTVAASKGADALVLGAFGCGAFRNDPVVVARAYRDALEAYGPFFSLIEFAIYCREYETTNYDAFRTQLCQA